MPLWQHVLVGGRMLRPVRHAPPAASEVQPRPGALHREESRWTPAATGAAGPRRPRRRPGPTSSSALDREGAAARHHLRLQPGRLPAGGRAVPALRAAADTPRTSATEVRAHVAGAHRATSRTRTCACWATGSGSTGWSGASPRTTPACCRPSRRSWRSCSPAAWSRRSSPPRRWRSGINMPARSVVLEKLTKWNGEAHADVTPGEYTQLTGRAGRRGIDVEGHAVVLWQPGLRPAAARRARLHPHLPAARRASGPSYNMAVNLVGAVGREPARALLESSFAQFQADRVGGRPGPAGQPQPRGARRLPRGDDLPPRRRAGVRRGCGRELKRREAELARQGAAHAPRRGRPLAGAAAAPATSSACPPGAAPGSPSCSTRASASATTSHPLVLVRGPLGRPAVVGRLPAGRRAARPGQGAAQRSTTRSPAGPPRPGRLAARARVAPAVPARGGAARRRPTTRCWPPCGRRCAGTRCTAATTARRTCAGPSGGPGCAATPTRSSARSRARRTRSRAPSTGSARCSRRLGYLAGERGHRRPGGSSPGSTASPTCSSWSACASGLWDGLSPAELAAVVSALVYETRRADDLGPPVPGRARCRRRCAT